MKSAIYVAGATLGLALTGCGSVEPMIARRATFDLGCRVGARDVHSLGGRQYGVAACGCRAVYIKTASNTFVLNNVSGSCGAQVTGGGEN